MQCVNSIKFSDSNFTELGTVDQKHDHVLAALLRASWSICSDDRWPKDVVFLSDPFPHFFYDSDFEADLTVEQVESSVWI